MKKWFKFFFLSFFSHERAKESAKRGYSSFFLGFVLALALLWAGFVGADMLPFGIHYSASPDFRATVYSVLANSDSDKRVAVEIKDGALWESGKDCSEGPLVNTFEVEADKQNYSMNGYDAVVDLRPADTLAEVEAYCVSNDGRSTEISYSDYLTLSEVARLNFDFKLRYTGKALYLDSASVENYRAYLYGLNDESKSEAEKLASELSENKITSSEYDRKIYELYFVNYYPPITAYESTSRVPLLRNYYYHQYVNKGITNYLFIFDDYMTGSFETKGGANISFHGFYTNRENGAVVAAGASQAEAEAVVDSFVKKSFEATGFLNLYAHMLNVFSLAPFIALMIMVAALLTYSVFKLRGVESVSSPGAMFKIVGSFVWFSGAVSALFAVIIAFFAERRMISTLPLVVFFAVLAIRALVFFAKESKLYMSQQEAGRTED